MAEISFVVSTVCQLTGITSSLWAWPIAVVLECIEKVKSLCVDCFHNPINTYQRSLLFVKFADLYSDHRQNIQIFGVVTVVSKPLLTGNTTCAVMPLGVTQFHARFSELGRCLRLAH